MNSVNVKKLQKEISAYSDAELAYDVYSDRINFIGQGFRYRSFFERRKIFTYQDRAGFSIDRKDAESFGLPLEANGYRLLPDSRKKPLVMN